MIFGQFANPVWGYSTIVLDLSIIHTHVYMHAHQTEDCCPGLTLTVPGYPRKALNPRGTYRDIPGQFMVDLDICKVRWAKDTVVSVS